MRMRQLFTVGVLAVTLPLAACQQGEQDAQSPGGGAGFQNSPIPGPPATELGNAYQRAYVSMANAYMEILQEDYNSALTHAQAAQTELKGIQAQAGKTLPETVADDLKQVDEVVAMLRERNPAVANRLQKTMISMTNHAESSDLARPEGAGGGAGTTERKTEGPGIAQPEPPPESQPERIRQEGPNSGQ